MKQSIKGYSRIKPRGDYYYQYVQPHYRHVKKYVKGYWVKRQGKKQFIKGHYRKILKYIKGYWRKIKLYSEIEERVKKFKTQIFEVEIREGKYTQNISEELKDFSRGYKNKKHILYRGDDLKKTGKKFDILCIYKQDDEFIVFKDIVIQTKYEYTLENCPKKFIRNILTKYIGWYNIEHNRDFEIYDYFYKFTR